MSCKAEEIFERRTEKTNGHFVDSVPNCLDERDVDATGKGSRDVGPMFEFLALGLYCLELDGDLFTRDYVGSKVDITCC